MGNISNYWKLIKPEGYATFKVNETEADQAQAWFYKQFPDLRDVSVTFDDRAIQRRLMEIRSAKMFPDHDCRMADYSLRCFISEQLMAGCNELAAKFKNQGLSREELYPCVLNDVEGFGKKSPSTSSQYRSLARNILEKFDPNISNLSTWTKRLMLQHKPLLSLLEEKNCEICFSTPWALLNDIGKIAKLKRILSNAGILLIPEKTDKLWCLIEKYYDIYCQEDLPRGIHTGNAPSFPTDKQLGQMVSDIQKELSSFQKEQRFLPEDRRFSDAVDITLEKIKQRVLNYCGLYKPTLEKLYKTWYLLKSYYDIYRDALSSSGSHAGRKYPPPTDEQLQQMSNRLQEFGFSDYRPDQIRKDLLTLASAVRQYKRPLSVNDPDSILNNLEQPSPGQDEAETCFSEEMQAKMQEKLQPCLDRAIEQVVGNRLPEKQRQRQRFLQAHCMFYCEGRIHDDIAHELDIGKKTIANDLKAERCIEDICHATVKRLCEQLEELGTAYYDQSQLQQLNNAVQKALKNVIKPEFDQAIAELFTPKNSSKRSLIGVRICYYVKRLIGELGL